MGADLGSLTPWGSAIQGAIGLGQSIFGAIKEGKATNALENLQTPTYGGDKSIKDYYNMALQRYNINPYQTQQYNYAISNANKSQAAGINALQDRRSAIGGISRLSAISNNAALQAGVTAENQKSQELNQLGGATSMQAADNWKQFQQNKLAPYEKEMQIQGLKASGGASLLNAGIGTINNAANNYGILSYGQNSNSTGTNGTTSFDGGNGQPPVSYEDYLKMKQYFEK